MKSLEILEIAKKNPEAASWSVEAAGVAPNTLISNPHGYTMIVKVDGDTKISGAKSFTVHSLYNPGKKTKMFGNKPYAKAEIIAFDQTGEYFAEWALAGPNALSSYDPEYEVDCKVIARGKYHYKVADFYAFFGTFTPDENGEVSREEIREHLRSEATGVIHAYLAAAIADKNMRACQAEIGQYCEEIRDEINKKLERKGLAVGQFSFEMLGYDRDHATARQEIDTVKMKNAKNHLANQGRLDDITVKDADTDITVKLIDAHARAAAATAPSATAPRAAVTVTCPRCGAVNESARYCKQCGEKL